MMKDPLPIDRLGFNARQIQTAAEMAKGKSGLILICGPKKAGKTATVEALLLLIKRECSAEIVVTGEIRDAETAQIAVRAPLTGCLVLSTLRADDTAEAFTRIVDFGVEPSALASVLKGIIVQKIVRKNKEAILLADVASARNKLRDVTARRYTADDLNDCFLHCTNVISEILKSIRCLPHPVYINRRNRMTERVYRESCTRETGL